MPGTRDFIGFPLLLYINFLSAYVIVLEEHKNKTMNGKYAHKYSAYPFGRNIRCMEKDGWLNSCKFRIGFPLSFYQGSHNPAAFIAY